MEREKTWLEEKNNQHLNEIGQRDQETAKKIREAIHVKNSAPVTAKEKAAERFIQGNFWRGQEWKVIPHSKFMFDIAAGRLPSTAYDTKGQAILAIKNGIESGYLADVELSDDGMLKIHDGFAGPGLRIYDAILQLANSHEKTANGKLLLIDLLKEK